MAQVGTRHQGTNAWNMQPKQGVVIENNNWETIIAKLAIPWNHIDTYGNACIYLINSQEYNHQMAVQLRPQGLNCLREES